jgi:excisionase family DNA binding protein
MSSAKQPPTDDTEHLGNFDINKVADHLSLHRSTVERMLHAGEFGKDWWRKGRKIIIPKENVFAYERREREKRLGTLGTRIQNPPPNNTQWQPTAD